MDVRGEPLPWYTYPAIQFLLSKHYTNKRVLEWGAGQSTRFWAKRAQEVVAFEDREDWCRWLESFKFTTVRIHRLNREPYAVENILDTQLFDVIVIDGLNRWSCAERSLNLLSEDGAIILDDSERNPGPRPGYGCVDLFRDAGFSRVDFIGYSPGNTVQKCTSLFFQERCFLFRGAGSPQIALSFWPSYPKAAAAHCEPLGRKADRIF